MKTPFLCFALTLLILNSFLTHTSSKRILNFTTDHHALLSFKNIISDPNGILAKSWTSTNTSICHWAGVSCGAKHQRVTSLNVSGFALRGNLAPHLGNLTFLRSLDISSNNFSGFIPSELSKLRRLEYLNAGFNNLSGGIPSWFGALSELQYVHLHNNTFSGEIPSSLFNISSIVEINMRYNSLSGELPNEICNNTPTLEALSLSGNQLYGQIPANIYKCRELEEFRLPRNHFNGKIPSEIGSLSMLRVLSLSWNDFQGGIPAEIGHLSRLVILIIQGASLTGNIPASIFNITTLKIMDLSNNNLFGSIPRNVFYTLPVIEELYLLYNHLTGPIPKQFGNLSSLKNLDLAYNRLTGELPEELGNLAQLEILAAPFNDFLSGSIPSSIFNISTMIALAFQQNNFSGSLPPNMGLSLFNLQELYLFFNKLSGEIPATITNASELIVLELNRNSFTGLIPDFGNLIYLQVLRLWENNLTGAESPTQELRFLSSLTNCQYLEVLEISYNPLNGILPPLIGNLSTSLQTISASNCNIKGAIPSTIVNLSSLVGLYLHENQITGYIPLNIGKLNQLQRIYLGSNRLKGHIPNDLCQMRKLMELNLSDNTLTGPIPGCLGKLRTLRELYLDSNKLNSTIPSDLWNLTDLRALNMSSNSLSGELSSQVGSLKSMNQLDLSFNQFLGDIPSSIVGCILLEILSLSNNTFQGSIPDSLGQVRSLNILYLDNNNLSGLIPRTLENLTLEYFDVSYNKLEGEIPDEGCFVNFTAESFAHNSALCGAARFGVPPCMKQNEKSKSVVVLMKYILPTVISAMIVVVVVVVLIRRRKLVKMPPSLADNPLGVSWRRVSYIELVRGTNSFSETSLLGRGSFGSVFKGMLSDGLDVAVKVFNLQSEGATKSFETESQMLSAMRHRNLLRIIGCCTNIEFKALILEYMPNGSLEKWLHSENLCLDMLQRVEIAIDVALALEYLHHGYTFPVVHCDIKPSNVLLDEDMTAHVSDFGIAKLFDEGETVVLTNTLATIGYAAPEYGSEGKVSRNGDVYSYGIMLLEMFTRKRPTDDMFNGEMSLKDWVSEALQENATSEVADPGLLAREDGHFLEKEQCVSTIFDLAMKCLAFSPNERIKMVEVAASLKKIRATFLAGTRRR
ncbi:hypothetical protein C2S52_014137 [Perilla frutescens var. hirtella]|nr:hypothetical protein C2S52_014137 [Perilla frutescens var. hirtella]